MKASIPKHNVRPSTKRKKPRALRPVNTRQTSPNGLGSPGRKDIPKGYKSPRSLYPTMNRNIKSQSHKGSTKRSKKGHMATTKLIQGLPKTLQRQDTDRSADSDGPARRRSHCIFRMSSDKKESFVKPEQPTGIEPYRTIDSDANPQDNQIIAPELKMSVSEMEEVVQFNAESAEMSANKPNNSIDSDEIEDALFDLKAAADESIGLYYKTKRDDSPDDPETPVQEPPTRFKSTGDKSNDEVMKEYLIQKQRILQISRKREEERKSLDEITEAERSQCKPFHRRRTKPFQRQHRETAQRSLVRRVEHSQPHSRGA